MNARRKTDEEDVNVVNLGKELSVQRHKLMAKTALRKMEEVFQFIPGSQLK